MGAAMRLVQYDGAVGAEREEAGGAEIYVAGIAAEDVPGGRHDDVLQHNVAREEKVIVRDHPRKPEDDDHGGRSGEPEIRVLSVIGRKSRRAARPG